MEPALSVKGLSIGYGRHQVLEDAELTLEEDEILAVLGPTGSGKTTLLRAIAGLEQPAGGEIRLKGRTIFGKGIDIAPEKRGIGMVFQDLAIWPHMSVGENIGFSSKSDAKETERILNTMMLEGLTSRMPSTLSGGQRQCVAIARAIASKPEVLLLDEPFTNLDWRIKEDLFDLLIRLRDEYRMPMIFVTHDQFEALSVADAFVAITDGRTERYEDAEELRRKPPEWFLPNMAPVRLRRDKGQTA